MLLRIGNPRQSGLRRKTKGRQSSNGRVGNNFVLDSNFVSRAAIRHAVCYNLDRNPAVVLQTQPNASARFFFIHRDSRSDVVESYVNKWPILVDNELFTRINLLHLEACTSRTRQAQTKQTDTISCFVVGISTPANTIRRYPARRGLCP